MKGTASKLRPLWLELVVAAGAILMIIALVYLLQSAMWAGATLFGDPPTPQGLALRNRLLTAAFLIGFVGGLAGITVATYTGQRSFRIVFGLIMVVTLLSGAWAILNR